MSGCSSKVAGVRIHVDYGVAPVAAKPLKAGHVDAAIHAGA
jgi:hypothetical protein